VEDALDAIRSFVPGAREAVVGELGHILPKIEESMHDTKQEVGASSLEVRCV
jgi:elongation factor 3